LQLLSNTKKRRIIEIIRPIISFGADVASRAKKNGQVKCTRNHVRYVIVYLIMPVIYVQLELPLPYTALFNKYILLKTKTTVREPVEYTRLQLKLTISTMRLTTKMSSECTSVMHPVNFCAIDTSTNIRLVKGDNFV
jgi:hypothetical protein